MGLRSWEGKREIRWRFADTFVQFGVELVHKNTAGPAVFDSFSNVEFAYLRVLNAIEHDAIVFPGNLCTKLVHNFRIWPCTGKGAHVFEIAHRVASEIRERTLETCGEPIDELCAPALSFLIPQNLLPGF